MIFINVMTKGGCSKKNGTKHKTDLLLLVAKGGPYQFKYGLNLPVDSMSLMLNISDVLFVVVQLCMSRFFVAGGRATRMVQCGFQFFQLAPVTHPQVSIFTFSALCSRHMSIQDAIPQHSVCFAFCFFSQHDGYFGCKNSVHTETNKTGGNR